MVYLSYLFDDIAKKVDMIYTGDPPKGANLKYFGVRNRNVRPVSQVPAQIIITRPTKMLAVCGAAVRGLNQQHDFIRQLTNHSPGLASCDLSDQSCPSI